MKIILSTIIFLLAIFFSAHAQKTVEAGSAKKIIQLKPVKEIQSLQKIQIEQPVHKDNSIYPLTITKRGSSPQHTVTRQDRIKSLRYLLEALGQKEKYLRSDSSLEKEAKANNWFEHANETREKVKAELKQLEASH